MLAQKIQTSEWIELSQLLVQARFDAVRQVCTHGQLRRWLGSRSTQLCCLPVLLMCSGSKRL
jgi:hypothetical protein